jgi:NAD+ diphosphatase
LLILQTYGARVWTLPGGALARRETPEAAVRREVKEEVGVSLHRVQYLGQFVSTQTYNVDTVHVFTALAPSRAYTLDRCEILEARWFAREALPPVSEKTRTALQLWLEREKTGAFTPVLHD